MYFLAYLVSSKLNVIVSKTWIYDIDTHWQKFVNNGINRNQKFLCFYSERPGAVINRYDLVLDLEYDHVKEPIASFNADFSLSKENIFPAEGCYDVNLIFYTGKEYKSHVLDHQFTSMNKLNFFHRIIP